MLLTELFPIEILDIIMSFLKFRDYVPFMFITKSFDTLLKLRNITFDNLKWALTRHGYDGAVLDVFPCGKFLLSRFGEHIIIGMFGSEDYKIQLRIHSNGNYILYQTTFFNKILDVSNIDKPPKVLESSDHRIQIQSDGEVFYSTDKMEYDINGIKIKKCCDNAYCSEILRLDKSNIIMHCVLKNIVIFYNINNNTDNTATEILRKKMHLLHVDGRSVVGLCKEDTSFFETTKKIIKITISEHSKNVKYAKNVKHTQHTEISIPIDSNLYGDGRYRLLVSDTINNKRSGEIFDLHEMKIVYKFDPCQCSGIFGFEQSETIVAIMWPGGKVEIFNIATWEIIKTIKLKQGEFISGVTHTHLVVTQTNYFNHSMSFSTLLIPV